MSPKSSLSRLRALPAVRRVVARAALVALVAVLAATGCRTRPPGELVPFTDEIRQRYQLDDAELHRLQFYVSERIVLERVAEKGEGRVDRGRLIVRSGTVIQQIVVPRGTPGAAEADAEIGDSNDGHVIEVSFDPGAALRFSAATAGGNYTLVDTIQRGMFADLLASFGQKKKLVVDFAGSRWPVVQGGTATLLIERSALGKLKRTQRILPGVKVKRR